MRDAIYLHHQFFLLSNKHKKKYSKKKSGRLPIKNSYLSLFRIFLEFYQATKKIREFRIGNHNTWINEENISIWRSRCMNVQFWWMVDRYMLLSAPCYFLYIFIVESSSSSFSSPSSFDVYHRNSYGWAITRTCSVKVRYLRSGPNSG